MQVLARAKYWDVQIRLLRLAGANCWDGYCKLLEIHPQCKHSTTKVQKRLVQMHEGLPEQTAGMLWTRLVRLAGVNCWKVNRKMQEITNSVNT